VLILKQPLPSGYFCDRRHLSTIDVASQSRASWQHVLKIGPGTGRFRVAINIHSGEGWVRKYFRSWCAISGRLMILIEPWMNGMPCLIYTIQTAKDLKWIMQTLFLGSWWDIFSGPLCRGKYCKRLPSWLWLFTRTIVVILRFTVSHLCRSVSWSIHVYDSLYFIPFSNQPNQETC
jgi:hypothetical protein